MPQMTKPDIYVFPPANTTAVAALQSLAAAGSLILNGSMAVQGPGANGLITVPFPNNYREITLTSTNNLSGVNFTITGTQAGTILSEVLVGPDNDTVTSVNSYDSITSIKTSAAASGVSAGIGPIGYITPWFYNPYATVAATSVQVYVGGTQGYSAVAMLSSLLPFYPPYGNSAALTGITGDSAQASSGTPAVSGNVFGVAMPQLNATTLGTGTPGVSDNSISFASCFAGETIRYNTSVIAYFNVPITYSMFLFENSTETALNGPITVAFLQQGVK